MALLRKPTRPLGDLLRAAGEVEPERAPSGEDWGCRNLLLE